ncbi:MAG: GNAT family N-acetyltransferase [Acidobacteria bacterium]|nr:GNAT family N-acetyltransferase [Acidobacteriota bacterium]
MKPIILTDYPERDVEDRWLAMLADADMATHYASPEYFNDRFVGAGRRFAVLAEDEGKIVAALTGVVDGGHVLSGFAVRPQSAFLSGTEFGTAFQCLVSGVLSLGSNPELIDIHLWRPVERNVNSFEARQATGADRIVMLDLSKGADELFKGFAERRRSQIRKVVKQGLVTVKDLETEQEVEQLYAIHCDWTAKKGIAADNEEDFRTLIGAKFRKTLIAVHDGRVVAGTYFRYFPGGVVEYAANNSLQECQRFHPNELLAWRAIEWACERRFRWLSMGASHPFLARFGGEIWSTWRYRKDNTFLRLHANRERLSRVALQTYNAIPETLKRKIRSARAA